MNTKLSPRKLHICLFAQEGWNGGIEYTKNLVYALMSLPHDFRSTFRLSVFCSRQFAQSAFITYVPGLNFYFQEDQPKFLQRLVNRIISHVSGKRSLDFFLEKEKVDFAFPYYCFNKCTFNFSTWIYDFQHRHLPHFFSLNEIRQRNKSFAAYTSAGLVIVNSNSVAADLKHFYPHSQSKLIILPFKIFPLSEWYENNSFTTKKYKIPERFFLISNQFWQHKNHLLVFEALKLLRQKNICPVLVCTGALTDYRNPGYINAVRRTVEVYGLGTHIYLLGEIPRIDQIQLLRRCLAVVQPSLFEGRGAIVEEAKLIGKPILLSNLPPHLEQAPPRAKYFTPDSAEKLSELLAEGWQKYASGIDKHQEKIGRERALKEIFEYGKKFLEIAKESGTFVR